MYLQRLTQRKLKEHLRYSKRTGGFTWIKPTSNRVRRGAVATGMHSQGYLRIGIFGRRYFAHQLAWFYMTGKWVPLIDHKDFDKRNNRWSNLRPLSIKQNVRHTIKCVGAWLNKRSRRWNASIKTDEGRKWLGSFSTKEEAQTAYRVAKKKYHGNGACIYAHR